MPALASPTPVAAAPVSISMKVVALPRCGSALGVDRSGSAQAGRKTWAAHVAFRRTGARLVRLWQPLHGQAPGRLRRLQWPAATVQLGESAPPALPAI
jgi:hypothetical protein